MVNLRSGGFKLLRNKYVIVVVPVLILVGLFFVSLPKIIYEYKDYQVGRAPKTVIANDATAAQNSLNKTIASKPQQSATLQQQLDYYDDLTSAYARNSDYKNAASSFEKRTALSSDGLDYFDYYYATQFYVALKNKTAAQAQLTKAQALIPAKSDPVKGSQHDDLVDATQRQQEVINGL